MICKENGVWTYPCGREVCKTHTAEGQREYKRRTDAMQKRQGGHCALCMWYLGVTFDHQSGRGSGGSHRDDRIEIGGGWHNAALCYNCNAGKGSKRYHWLDGHYVPNSGKQSVYETPDAGAIWEGGK